MKKTVALILLCSFTLLSIPIDANAATAKKATKSTKVTKVTKPKKVQGVKVGNVLKALVNVRSLDYSLSGIVKMSRGSHYGSSDTTVSVDSSGQVEFNLANPNAQTTNSVRVMNSGKNDRGSSEQMSVEALFDFLVSKGDAYVKINNFNFNSSAPSDSEFTNSINKYKNVWVKLDQALSPYNSVKRSVSDASREDIDNSIAQLEKKGILTVTRLNDTKVINGIKAQHYTLKISVAKILETYAESYKQRTGHSMSKSEKAYLAKSFNTYKIGTSDLWVDESTSLPVRYIMNAAFVADPGSSYSYRIDYSFQLDLSNFNVIPNVQAPASYINYKDLDMVKESRQKGEDASVMSTMANMRAQSELYYSDSNSYKGICTATSKNSNKYLVDAIKQRSGETPLCNEKPDGMGYAYSSKLKTGYFCIDSQGAAKKKTSALPNGVINCDY